MVVEAARGANLSECGATRKASPELRDARESRLGLLLHHAGAHLDRTVPRSAELYQDRTISTVILGMERIQDQVGQTDTAFKCVIAMPGCVFLKENALRGALFAYSILFYIPTTQIIEADYSRYLMNVAERCIILQKRTV